MKNQVQPFLSDPATRRKMLRKENEVADVAARLQALSLCPEIAENLRYWSPIENNKMMTIAGEGPRKGSLLVVVGTGPQFAPDNNKKLRP